MIDAHNHLDFPAFDADRAEVVARARASGVERWVIAGARPADWSRTVRVAQETGGIALLGVHPWFVSEIDDVDAVIAELRQSAPRGIGEIGLDAISAKSAEDRAQQRVLLRAQLALARERDCPVAFHCVRAFPELLTVVERDGLPAAGGMVHGWSGPAGQAERAVALGLMVSFGPLVAQERAQRVREAAAAVPVDRLLVETDAPDQPLNGQERGEPADVVAVLEVLAELRGDPVARLARVTHENAGRLLG